MGENTEIIFMRHGQSEKNILEINSSTRDKHPLTEKGRREVKKLAKKITKNINVIISSPILRAVETAEIVNKRLKKKIEMDDGLSEYDFGEWNDIPKKRLLENNESYQEYKQIESLKDKFNFRLGKIGESRKEAIVRVEKFLRTLIKKYRGKTVLLVSHGGINAAIMKILKNYTIEEYFRQEQIDHNSIQYFTVNEDGRLISHKSVE